jgi:hypothetical protein
MLGTLIVWFFESLWHALVGLVLLVGFFGGSVVLLARAIAQSTAHDQAKCDCVDCKRRRIVASDKRKNRNPRPLTNDPRRRTNELWISTLELVERGRGTRVGVKGIQYELKEIEMGNGAWVLYLTNLKSRQRSVVTVKYEAGHRKYWKLGDGWFS